MTYGSGQIGLQLRSLAKDSGELELSLVPVPTPKPGPDEVVVHVECAPGVSVERLALRRALDAAVEVRPITLHATATARVADATFHLRAPRDDVFVVTAESPTPAYAMTGPLWIDADGDGESLGRKVDDIAPAVRDKKKTP